MGKRGPPRTPTKQLKLVGSWRGKHRESKGEPKPRATMPRCPGWLDKRARDKWRQLVPELKAMGVLTAVDGEFLAVLCQTWAEWREATEFIQKHGGYYPIKHKDGTLKYMQQFPQVAAARKAKDMLYKYGTQFGLSPASRAGMAVGMGQQIDELEEFFGQPRRKRGAG